MFKKLAVRNENSFKPERRVWKLGEGGDKKFKNSHKWKQTSIVVLTCPEDTVSFWYFLISDSYNLYVPFSVMNPEPWKRG